MINRIKTALIARRWLLRKSVTQIREDNRKKANRQAASLSNSYLNGKIRSSHGYIGGEITDTQREIKRKEILALRESKANGQSKLTSAHKLTDAYIRKIITGTKGYDGSGLTEQPIAVALISDTGFKILPANKIPPGEKYFIFKSVTCMSR